LIQYVKNENIDKAQWDACISNSPNGLVYAYSWYLDIVCPGWCGLVEDTYSRVMPLPTAEKYGFSYTYPAPHTQQLGLFSPLEITEADVQHFLAHIPALYRYIEMNLNLNNQLEKGQFKITKGITHLLDLNGSYKDILAGYSSQTKRNLKKTRSNSLTILKNAEPQKIIGLFKANRGKEYAQTTSHYSILNTLMNACISKGYGQSWGVFKEEALCAGAFLLESNGKTIFLFSGTNHKAYETHAMTFLINQYLEEHAGQNCIFDFEGSADKDVARFYKGFGSTEKHYLHIRKNTLPLPVKLLKEIQYRRKSISYS